MGSPLTLSRDWLLDDVTRRFGISGSTGAAPLTIGAELELIPLHVDTRLPVPIESHTTACSLDILRRAGVKSGWRERPMGSDPSSWELASGARISFEPGGQIEVSSAPHSTATALIAELSGITSALHDTFERHGVFLETRGIDPHNAIEQVPLQLHRERYERMTQYFELIGPSGIQMMRQTASVQVNVEPGGDPLARWSLLNRLAPALVAMFANSSQYAGSGTEHASYRAHLWRTLDQSRTGMFTNDNPIESYCDFAVGAGWMFGPSPDKNYESFGRAIESGASEQDWNLHVSTLFPEVRPRQFFEVRSPDMVDLHWIAAPIAIIAGICYDPESAAAATELLKDFDGDTLIRAGRDGLADDEIRSAVGELSDIALRGCAALGHEYLSHEDLDILCKFVDCYPANGRSPADNS